MTLWDSPQGEPGATPGPCRDMEACLCWQGVFGGAELGLLWQQLLLATAGAWPEESCPLEVSVAPISAAKEAVVGPVLNEPADLPTSEQPNLALQREPKAKPGPHVLLASSPALTWRDMQHLVVRSSQPAHLQAEDWAVNGVGRQGELQARPLPVLPPSPAAGGPAAPQTGLGHLMCPLLCGTCSAVSHHYGYGLLDAGRLVEMAKAWTGTRPQRTCSVKALHAPR